MKFSTPFLFQKIEVYVPLIRKFLIWAMVWIVKHLFYPSEVAKKHDFRFPEPGTSDVIMCVTFKSITLCQCSSFKVTTICSVLLAIIFSGKCPQRMNYPVIDHLRLMLSRCIQLEKRKAP